MATVLLIAATPVAAQEQLIEATASFVFNGRRVLISRDAPHPAAQLHEISSTDSAYVAPMQVAPGVTTLGEVEVLDFLQQEVAENTGLMLDARLPGDRARGFIPGSVSLPAKVFSPDNAFRDEVLKALGARAFEGVYNFSEARKLLIYDGGPGADDAGELVRNLLATGYPAEMIKYYRGGMQVWSVLGFSVERPAS